MNATKTLAGYLGWRILKTYSTIFTFIVWEFFISALVITSTNKNRAKGKKVNGKNNREIRIKRFNTLHFSWFLEFSLFKLTALL